jgi:transposase
MTQTQAAARIATIPSRGPRFGANSQPLPFHQGVGVFIPMRARVRARGTLNSLKTTSKEVDDGVQVGPLLDQVTGSLTSLAADGAYDQDGVYAAVTDRHPAAEVIVPPRITAVPSRVAETAPTQRDRHLRCIAEKGRMAWQKSSRYNQRAKVEATIGRWKQVIGTPFTYRRTSGD